ncbi:MAG: pyruvate kinase [Candidatus Zhuqueibacterota bacterium]
MSPKQLNYQIIATLGPAVKNRVSQLISAGATGFRLNCSHLTLEEISRWLIELEQAFSHFGDALPVWLDLQGSKMRIGKLARVIILERGKILTFKNSYSQIDDEIPLPHGEIFKRIQSGDLILLDDGKIELRVQTAYNGYFNAEVINFGELSSYKGFLIRNKNLDVSKPAARDVAFIEQTRHLKFVGYAISYIHTSKEIKQFRSLALDRPIVAKIERQKAFDQLRNIARVSDMLWLCRGDLGADGTIYELFHFEKKFIRNMALMKTPSLIAGQVLGNMVTQSCPSRSEIAHLGYLIENGFVGLVLSDETAIGKYPVQAVEFCRNYFEYTR